MDKRRKCALALMELGDSIIEKKRRRASIIRRAAFSVSGLCAAVLIGVGIWSNSAVQTPPDREPSSSIMVTETSPATESPQTTAVPSPTVTRTVPSTERQAPAKTESTPSAPSAPAYAPATTAAPVIQASVTAPVTAAVTQMQTAATPATTESLAVTTTPQTENLYDPRKTYTFELDGITYEVSGEAADLEFFQSIDFVEYTEMLTEDDSGNVTSVKGCIASAQPLSEMVFFQILCVVETENGQKYFIAHPIN